MSCSPASNPLPLLLPADPLEHHRKRDKASDKGEGMRFLFCCCAPKVEEPAATAERYYSMKRVDTEEALECKGK